MKQFNSLSSRKKAIRSVGLAVIAAAGAAALWINKAPVTAEAAENGSAHPMYCLYSMDANEYFYTGDENEKDQLKQNGWDLKGIGWYAPEVSSTPVFRLFNSETGSHYFTDSTVKRDYLVGEGWNNEGIAWYSSDDQEVAVYHKFNPNSEETTYKYAVMQEEYDEQANEAVWQVGEIAWYGVQADPDQVAEDQAWVAEEIREEKEAETNQDGPLSSENKVDLTGAKDLGNFYLTAYYNPWGTTTASGAPTVANHTIAQNSLPFGSRVYIEGLGIYTVEDRGAASHGSHWIDVYYNTVAECYSLPVLNARVYLLP